MGIVVDFKNVSIERAEHLVLQNVSFQLKSGEFCYLVGKVGSVKIRLMKSNYLLPHLTKMQSCFIRIMTLRLKG